MHECDLFIIKKSGVAVEVEIKRSKSDLLADFKKRHNHHDRQNRITELYFALPEELYESCKDLIHEDAGIITCYRWDDYNECERLGAQTKRKPKRIKGARKLTEQEQLKIARLGTIRIWSLKQKMIKNENSKKKLTILQKKYTDKETALVKWMSLMDFYNKYEWAFKHNETIKEAL